MKTYIVRLWLALLLCFVIGACADNDYAELDKGSTELELTANAGSLTLEEAQHGDEALELKWTTGTNYGSGNRISYTLELAEAGSSFANPVKVVDNQTQVYSWKQSTEDLNTLLLKHWGGREGLKYNVEAKVTAVVAGMDKMQVASTNFTVSAYEPVTSTLFVKGTSTNGNAEAMTRTDNGSFTWTGMLHTGTFMFTTTADKDYPAYVLDKDGRLVLQNTAQESAGEAVSVKADHYYTVEANLLTGELTMKESDGIKPPYDQLFLVGEMTDWKFVPMHQDVLDPFLFRYGQIFEKGGEFKFGTANGSWEKMYKAVTENAPYTNTKVEFVKGFDPDNKWKLKDNETGKAYKICLDIRSGKERMMMQPFIPYKTIYLIGQAAPGGWSMDDATPMKADSSNPYILTWSGRLNAGELKFTCDKQSDWNGAWFMPAKDGSVSTGQEEQMLFVNKSDESFKAQYPDANINSVDYKWSIPTEGNYTIILNQLTETVTIEKK